MKNYIITLGDSIALKRKEKRLPISSYIEHVSTALDHKPFIQFNMGGATSRDLVSQSHSLTEQFTCDEVNLLIVQIGIVDCTPRLYPKMLNRHVKLKKYFIKINKLLKIYDKSWVGEEEFEYNVRVALGLLKTVGLHKIVFLSILPACGQLLNKINSINLKIDRYNRLIFKLCEEQDIKFLDLSTIKTDGFLKDGHHLDETGHQSVSKKILEVM